jgi:hypothetical protein
MLAQSFLTAADLGIPSSWVAALIKVLGMLERGEIKKVPLSRYTHDAEETDDPPHGFNMRQFRAYAKCGTICCIGGWAEFVGDLRKGALVKGRLAVGREELDNLFDPSNHGFPLEPITTTQAATALRNYLTTGNSQWHEVLAN